MPQPCHNAAFTWNAVYTTAARTELGSEGTAIPDDVLAHLAPAEHQHINIPGQSTSALCARHDLVPCVCSDRPAAGAESE